jgi:hypothetical protein
MTYPTSIPDFRNALLAYEPDEATSEAIYTAQAAGSPVVQAVDVFTVLSGAVDLDQPGLALLLSAAHLIAAGGWHGKAGEAATVLAARAGELEAAPPIQSAPA